VVSGFHPIRCRVVVVVVEVVVGVAADVVVGAVVVGVGVLDVAVVVGVPEPLLVPVLASVVVVVVDAGVPDAVVVGAVVVLRVTVDGAVDMCAASSTTEPCAEDRPDPGRLCEAGVVAPTAKVTVTTSPTCSLTPTGSTAVTVPAGACAVRSARRCTASPRADSCMATSSTARPT
jgi:hypothetical protein